MLLTAAQSLTGPPSARQPFLSEFPSDDTLASPHRDLVTLAFQVSGFLATNYRYSELVIEHTREQIDRIVSANLRAASERARSRRRFRTTTEAQPVQPPRLWPEDWVVDSPAFRNQSTHSSLLLAPHNDQAPNKGILTNRVDCGPLQVMFILILILIPVTLN